MPFFRKRTNKRGDTVWQIQVFCGYDADGKPVMKNLTSQSPRKKDAVALAAQVLKEHASGELVAKKITVSSLLDAVLLDYKVNGKDLKWAERIIRKHLRPVFGDLCPEKVTTTALQKFIAQRQGEGATNGTINGNLAILRRAFNLGSKATPPTVGRVPRCFPMLQLNNTRTGFFEDSEYRAMLRELPEELKPVLAFAYFSGSRKSEILGLQWSQVDLAKRVVRLEAGETKNKRARTIPLGQELLEVLKMQRATRDQLWPKCPWVFHRFGQRLKNFPSAWKAACKRAGLWDEERKKPTKLFHDLRRSAVRNLIRAGASETVAMRISGHLTRSVFDRYNVTNEADLRDAARKLDEYLASKQDAARTAEAKVTPLDQHQILN